MDQFPLSNLDHGFFGKLNPEKNHLLKVLYVIKETTDEFDLIIMIKKSTIKLYKKNI